MIIEHLELSGTGLQQFSEILFDISIEYNKILLSTYGGAKHSIIKKNELLSACYRPVSSAFGEDLFKTDYDKSAALLDALIQAHGFSDGNKRTSIVVTEYFLKLCELQLTLTQDEKYDLVHDIESKKYSIETLSSYIKKNSKKI